jgi:hypothetical protein
VSLGHSANRGGTAEVLAFALIVGEGFFVPAPMVTLTVCHGTQFIDHGTMYRFLVAELGGILV